MSLIPNNILKPKKLSLKQQEDIRITKICDTINNNSKLGIKLRETYYDFYNKHIDNVIKVGGNSDHYDIKVIHTDITHKQIEVKSRQVFYPSIKNTNRPWEISVQFLNGPGNKFSITGYYAKLWYDNIVCNRDIVGKFVPPNIKCPEFDEWKCKDAFKCGDPLSEFGVTLKQNYRLMYPKSSMLDYRKIVNDKFEFTEDYKIEMIDEVQHIYNKCMSEKEGWLQTFGDPDDIEKFNFKWFDKVDAYKIIDINCIKSRDILFEIKCENDYKFNAILRWGKGSGFSNIRLDLK